MSVSYKSPKFDSVLDAAVSLSPSKDNTMPTTRSNAAGKRKMSAADSTAKGKQPRADDASSKSSFEFLPRFSGVDWKGLIAAYDAAERGGLDRTELISLVQDAASLAIQRRIAYDAARAAVAGFEIPGGESELLTAEGLHSAFVAGAFDGLKVTEQEEETLVPTSQLIETTHEILRHAILSYSRPRKVMTRSQDKAPDARDVPLTVNGLLSRLEAALLGHMAPGCLQPQKRVVRAAVAAFLKVPPAELSGVVGGLHLSLERLKREAESLLALPVGAVVSVGDSDGPPHFRLGISAVASSTQNLATVVEAPGQAGGLYTVSMHEGWCSSVGRESKWRQLHRSELWPVPPVKKDAVFILTGDLKGDQGIIIGIDGSDGIIKMRHNSDIKVSRGYLPLSSVLLRSLPLSLKLAFSPPLSRPLSLSPLLTLAPLLACTAAPRSSTYTFS